MGVGSWIGRLLLATWVLLPVTGSARAADVSPTLAPLLEAGQDELVNRTYVSPISKPIGEIRLVRRGDATVVQTALYTSMLKRVVAEIAGKESANWPQDRPGHEDAVRYVDALKAAQKKIWDSIPNNSRNPSIRQNLLIEFVSSPTAAAVFLLEYDLEDGPDGVEIHNRRLLTALELSRDYVLRDQTLIVADNFKVSEDEAKKLLDEVHPAH